MTHDLLTHVTHKTSVLLAFAKEADIHELGNSLLKHPFQIRHVRAFAFSSSYAISRRKCVESTFVFAWHKLHIPFFVCRCDVCNGDGRVKCPTCLGNAQLKTFIEMTVKW